jgi:hypothetical protein
MTRLSVFALGSEHIAALAVIRVGWPFGKTVKRALIIRVNI